MAKLIRDLPVGAKVRFGKHQVNNETRQDIIWQVAAKDHPGYPSNSITLITEKIIDLRGFDAREPSNSNSDRQKYGNNRYRDSNIRQWLNKAGLNWYVKTHTADEPPTDDGMTQPTGYDNKEGFLSSFTEDELNIILDTTLTVARNTITDGGGSETVVDKIFLASSTEVGFENENGIAEGSLLPLFSDGASRIAYVTQQCINNTKSWVKPSSISNGWYWWLRTPSASSSRYVRFVYFDSSSSGYHGVRPLCNLKSDICVSDNPDSNGVYTLIFNAPPTITLSTTDNRTLYENGVLSISGNAKDEDSGDVVTVRYNINNGTTRAITTAISDGSNIPFNKTLTFKQNKLYDGTTAITGELAEGAQHTLKVWAEDDKGGKSTEQTRVFYVVPNRPAVLTINPFSPREDLIDTDYITITGRVSDPDGNDVTVSYKIANGSYKDIYSGTGGDFQFQIQLSNLAVGKNTITVQAKDSYGANTVKTLEVTKAEDLKPLLTSVARYKLTPPNNTAKGIVLWIEREVGDLTVDVEISMGMNGEEENFVPMTKTATAFVREGIEEDEWVFESDSPKENIIIKITMNRTSPNSTQGITLISGVLS